MLVLLEGGCVGLPWGCCAMGVLCHGGAVPWGCCVAGAVGGVLLEGCYVKECCVGCYVAGAGGCCGGCCWLRGLLFEGCCGRGCLVARSHAMQGHLECP